jgi:hypothetical protein
MVINYIRYFKISQYHVRLYTSSENDSTLSQRPRILDLVFLTAEGSTRSMKDERYVLQKDRGRRSDER